MLGHPGVVVGGAEGCAGEQWGSVIGGRGGVEAGNARPGVTGRRGRGGGRAGSKGVCVLIEKCVCGGERGEGGGAIVKGISRPMEQL